MMRCKLAVHLPVCLLACLAFEARGAKDPLPSWNDTGTKRAIVDFVARVTDPKSKAFVEPADRIASFDNDGTLWVEKPLYTHFFAIFGRYDELVKKDPGLKAKQPYKAILEKDKAYFGELIEKGEFGTIVSDFFGVPFQGASTEEFASWNRDWLVKWKHPRFQVGYRHLIYQPMLELLQYLRANDFDVYIATADEAAFLQLVSEELYGVPSQKVLGSSIALKYQVEGGSAGLTRTAEMHFLNNWDGKPRKIFRELGKRPILAGGNSNGDLHMLQWVAGQKRPSLSLLVHHTDGEREYQYDKHTEKVLPLARKEGWTVIDVKDDWRTVFPGP